MRKLLGLLTASFLLSRVWIRLLPGNPAEMLLAETSTALSLEQLEKQFRLDQGILASLPVRTWDFISLNWGRSLYTQEPVTSLVGRRLIHSLELVASVLPLSVLLGIALGCFLATQDPQSRRYRWMHRGLALFASTPLFWLGSIVLLALAIWLRSLPLEGGLGGPLLSLMLPTAALWARLSERELRLYLPRSSVLGAQARGVTRGRAIVLNGFLPVAGPLMAFFGNQFGAWVGGLFVVETLFGWQGIGSLMIESVSRRDYPVLENGLFFVSALAISANALGATAQSFWNRRSFSRTGGGS